MPITLFEERHHELPNVASVPQYSPLRYPGGKSRWYRFVKKWVLEEGPEIFVEPFAGGAHAGLAVAIEKLSEKVVLVELDENVSAVWKAIVEGDAEWLIDRIENFEMSKGAAQEAVEKSDQSTRGKAFAMIVHNRVSRGGVTAPGAGWLNEGEGGNGLNSRWYPETLVDRIRKIAEVSSRIEVIHGDGLETMREYSESEEAALFVDPPYPKAGGRLYEHSNVNHREIFRIASSTEGPVLLTYDNSDEIESLVDEFGLEAEYLLVSTTHHREKKELLIGEDLGWLAGL
jgi:DNA adenine methylase